MTSGTDSEQKAKERERAKAWIAHTHEGSLTCVSHRVLENGNVLIESIVAVGSSTTDEKPSRWVEMVTGDAALWIRGERPSPPWEEGAAT
jgi:hypothetical protein